MKLTSVQISDYKCIREACQCKLSDITCLVGKNESGKIAILEALYRLNPVIPDHGSFNVDDDYPRIDVEDYRLDIEEGRREPAIVTQATFALEPEDMAEINRDFPGVAAQPELILSKGYANELYAELTINEEVVVEALLKKATLPAQLTKSLVRCSSLTELADALKPHEKEQSVSDLLGSIDRMQSKGLLQHLYERYFEAKVPKFLYFDEFYQMKGHVNIQALIERKQNNRLLDSDYPLLGLIDLARLNLEEISNPRRALERDNRLEGASNHLTRNIMRYWSQNRFLEMRFDIRPGLLEDPEGMQTGTNLWGHVYNSKQKVSTLLGRRSKGFIWFFSFLAWFSQQKRKKTPLILLLDEPSLFLHGSAQKDLLRFLEDECAEGLQVVYTTQSPYMVDPRHLDRARVVEDRSTESEEFSPTLRRGTQVYTDVNQASRESIHPLSGALANSLLANLAPGSSILVVDDLPELIYLQSISSLLTEKGRAGLDPRWAITPIGGAKNLTMFASLLGDQGDRIVAALLDTNIADLKGSKEGKAQDLLRGQGIYTYSDFCDFPGAALEDLFSPDFYVDLVNKAYVGFLKKPLSLKRLGAGDRNMVARIRDHFASMSHTNQVSLLRLKPAQFLACHRDELAESIPEETLSRFENIFGTFNAVLRGSQ
jgi:hypothetical protein